MPYYRESSILSDVSELASLTLWQEDTTVSILRQEQHYKQDPLALGAILKDQQPQPPTIPVSLASLWLGAILADQQPCEPPTVPSPIASFTLGAILTDQQPYKLPLRIHVRLSLVLHTRRDPFGPAAI